MILIKNLKIFKTKKQNIEKYKIHIPSVPVIQLHMHTPLPLLPHVLKRHKYNNKGNPYSQHDKKIKISKPRHQYKS